MWIMNIFESYIDLHQYIMHYKLIRLSSNIEVFVLLIDQWILSMDNEYVHFEHWKFKLVFWNFVIFVLCCEFNEYCLWISK